ncbi:MAG: serine/threonine protein kinase, partial [Acidobacteriota bacterium]|nr:serine/threonine protein kinase [Acidobacteriota bacterium]
MLAGRYRIVGLLGRGGMGEVYRADDLKLGQPVALKFLPAELERDQDRLSRLLNEVKLARQVSHPNVCRVYDVGEVDGHHFISMEYVDGENLGSLLRQIGRLPKDKAVQISRQICAGLAAAHEQGILHRDLKPANVMIDGRGRARITDFGLAEIAGQTRAEDARSGTPQYMAPEQLTGGRVSTQSDLYSLGLVLYELFTGKRVFDADTLAELTRLHEQSTPTSPSSHVAGFDPAVERVILRCLEKDPQERPSSALSIAAALPGGDPLAAALAAGETPSPEMVAAAGPKGGLHPGIAAACVATVVLGIVAHAALGSGMYLYDRVPLTKSFDALVDDAREIAVALGHDEPPGDRSAWFHVDQLEAISLSQAKEGEPGPELVDLPGQNLVTLSYRQRAGRLVPSGLSGGVSSSNPPPLSGDVNLRVDLRGKLVDLLAPPPLVERSVEPAADTDWAGLFELAGLDLVAFDDTEPTLQPLLYADTRRAWIGVLPDQNDRPVRIEAASTRGKPVFFRMVDSNDPEWPREDEEADERSSEKEDVSDAAAEGSTNEHVREDAAEPDMTVLDYAIAGFLFLVLATLLGGVLLLVLRNLKLGRGDRRGALRLALLVVTLRLLYWLFTGHHVAHPDEIYLLTVALAGAIGLGVLVWVLYIALEPYLRRVWPQAIVSWSR